MIFNLDFVHICPHLRLEPNAQLSYLSSGQISYLLLSQIRTNVTNIIFEPHLDCICLTSNLFFCPVPVQYALREAVEAELKVPLRRNFSSSLFLHFLNL